MTLTEYLQRRPDLTTLEVFQKALSEFLGKPLTVRNEVKVREDFKRFMERKPPPHYVYHFLEKERKRNLRSLYA